MDINLDKSNNKRHFDIAHAALVHVTHGNKLIRWIIMKVIKYWSDQCNKCIDKDWINDHKGLIAGDWKHFKSNK